ncbi:DUF1992 domain-containing protein [Streptomyces sp. A7024]|uniref:DUF1992 domain-containing protein n=1 Tax=Streptomyces coryli TaxID=1128680 RepID=A0A6G4UEX3_9ACTN|nr:DUF1992 domain-containing protein [Streptomyces coryli]NGN70277.1 DUF1992 domain-containing protein [Streptomyces coryli]
MTERKPPGVGFESWVDRQIREAEQRGEFENLPGRGKPLRGESEPYDEMWWLRQKIEDENLSYVPPTLALRKDDQDALAAARKARSEQEVRQLITDINTRIREAIRHPLEGPPLNMAPLDVERVVREWRATR